jgi:hypothetical protein
MRDRICFTIPTTKVREAHKRCVYIPVVFPSWPYIPNPPDPPYEDGPLPEPWLDAIDAKLGLSLQVLASIHALSAFLSGEASETVRKVIRAEAGRLQLPAGLELHMAKDRPG